MERDASPTQFSRGLITFLRSLLTPDLWDYVIWNQGKVSPKKKEETVENRKKKRLCKKNNGFSRFLRIFRKIQESGSFQYHKKANVVEIVHVLRKRLPSQII